MSSVRRQSGLFALVAQGGLRTRPNYERSEGSSVVDRRLTAGMTITPAMAIARQIRTMNNVGVAVASVEEPHPDPRHADGASAARITGPSDDVSSSMIDPTVANSDPVPSRAEIASLRSALPPNRS